MNLISSTAGNKKVDAPCEMLRVEDCELSFQNGEMSVTFRLSLPVPASAPASVPRRMPTRPSKSKV